MSNTILILFLTLCLAGCGVNSNTQSVCKCCDNAFTSIEKALDCIELTQTKDRKQDNRLLLLAFVPYELDSVQALGWKIIPDKDIIRIAKQKYLLIVLDSRDLSILNAHNKEAHFESYSRNENETLFMVTNQVLYPFAAWNQGENSDKIIDYLNVGDGP